MTASELKLRSRVPLRSRWHLLIVVVWLGLPAHAIAKPSAAVVTLEGDADGKVTAAVVEEAGKHAKITGAKAVAKAMDALDLSDVETARALKKLRTKLAVDAVVHGRVLKVGKGKRLELTVSGKAKKGTKIEIDFKSATAKSFRKELRDELTEKIAGTVDDSKDEDTDDDDNPKKKVEDDPPPKKVVDDDPPVKKKHDDDDEHVKKKKVADDDDDSVKVRKHKVDDEDEDSGRHHKKKHHHDEDDDAPDRHPVTQAAVWFDAGATGLHRALTYDTTGSGATPAPSVGTASVSGEIEGEVYPWATTTLKGPAAGFGLAGSFGKTVALSIAVPGTTLATPIKEGRYTIGVRYRFVFGMSSVAIGLDYWSQYYIADRSSLASPSQLDMPDVDYTAVAPNAIAKFSVAPKIGLFAALSIPLVMATGDIEKTTSYGRGSVIAVAANAGVDVALDKHYGLRLAAMADQLTFSFAGGLGSMAGARGVTAATDRTLGVTAAFAVIY